jgi:hypothetical protein
MPSHKAMALEEYVNQIHWFRKEFLKRSGEYIARKDEMRSKAESRGNCLPDEVWDSILIPDFKKLVPDESGNVTHVKGGELVAISDAPELIEFTLKVNPYSTIEELKDALTGFKKETERFFKKIKKYSYAASQTIFQYDVQGRIEYFSVPGKGEPFSRWTRLLTAYDLKQKLTPNTRIGQIVNSSYGGIQGTALLRAVREDLKEAHRLINCSRYENFPCNPPLKKDISSILQPSNLRPPKYVIDAFQLKFSDPTVQKTVKEFSSHAKPYKTNQK